MRLVLPLVFATHSSRSPDPDAMSTARVRARTRAVLGIEAATTAPATRYSSSPLPHPSDSVCSLALSGWLLRQMSMSSALKTDWFAAK